MKKNPVIGISGSFIIDEGGMFPGYKRAYVNNDYVRSVTMWDAIPFIVPIIENEELIKKQVEKIDALILSGGHDINPLLWGEEPHHKLGDMLPIRDKFDILLFKIASEMKKPILGVCRGHQVINVAEGGSMYQDLSLMDNWYIKHSQNHLPNIPTHSVNIEKDTKLYSILGEENIFVNSFHHQVINELAPGYIASAISKDGAIEAIELEGDDFIIGVQWHPEMMSKDNLGMQKIFKALIKEASK